ncbi:hypothetical protein M514_03597 [Trichuris suis]|uniref:Uncharacterized protein n=1 Tax=Trichuris suis TaxID=68888 RepID=A0A085ME99_9BILA|nr:hypothetical protein M513_03597 [Trichuris suis]KFD62973.1 hypothetical protein M514_03597 [Trichuris suis]
MAACELGLPGSMTAFADQFPRRSTGSLTATKEEHPFDGRLPRKSGGSLTCSLEEHRFDGLLRGKTSINNSGLNVNGEKCFLTSKCLL